MNKREMIEMALGSLPMEQYKHELIDQSGIIDTLAEQAIVVECEVEHTEDLAQPYTAIVPAGRWARGFWDFGNQRGHFGTPGKALAIIVPLEEEDVAQDLNS